MNKIPWTYLELLHEIYNYPNEFRKVVRLMGYNKYHFYWCKDRNYIILWSTINDFLAHPEKYTIEYHLNNESQMKLL